MIRFKLTVAILLPAIIAGNSLRIAGTINKRQLSHDEGISYLAATGHQASYSYNNNKSLSGTWVQACEWKKLLRPEKLFCFKEIGYGLAHHDIHPPLYFWLLHLWSFLFGVKLWTGPSLNILIALVTALSLFGLARYTLGNSIEAAIVTFTWSLSWTVAVISLTARQYDLFALLTVLFVWQVVKSTDLTRHFKQRGFIILALLTAAGALTHYHFSLVVIGCIIFSIIKLIKKNKYRLIAECVSIGIGCIIFFLLHPHFYLSLPKQRVQLQAFEYKHIIPRMKIVGLRLIEFFGIDYIWLNKYMVPLLSAAFIACLFVICFKRRLRLINYIRKVNFSGFYMLYFFLWIGGATILLYIRFLSPGHAMAPRHMSAAWPFYAFIPVFLLRFCGKLRVLLSVLFCFALLVLGCRSALHDINYIKKIPNPTVLLENSDAIIVDNVERGIFPRFFWYIPDGKFIFAATQDYLLTHPDAWLDYLSDKSIYISELTYGNTAECSQKILNLINQRYRITQIKGGIWGLGYVFKIESR